MKLNLSKIDADSFPGKLYLLVVEKVLIGALIAVAFIIYDRWKTDEVRRYESARQVVEFSFRRAEYVKELVPLVLDSSKDVLFRAHAFAALVDTGAIDANSAVNLMQKLLLAGVLDSSQYPIGEVGEPTKEFSFNASNPKLGEDFLAATMLKLMPAGLPTVLSEYTYTAARLDDGRKRLARDDEQIRRLQDAERFWLQLVFESIRHLDGGKLSMLDAGPFLVHHFHELAPMAHRLSQEEEENWCGHKVLGPRLLGSIGLLGDLQRFSFLGSNQKQSAYAPLALQNLKRVINPPPGTGDLALACVVMKSLIGARIAVPELSEEALEIVRSGVRATRMDTLREPDQELPRAHVDVAAVYVSESAANPKVVSLIEPRVLTLLGQFRTRIGSAPVDSLGDESGYRAEQELVRFLMNSRSADGQGPSKAARQFLTELFAIGDEKLRRTGLARLSADWHNGNGAR